MPFAQLSRVRQHYYERGHGSGRIWQLVQEALPEDQYHTIAPDNRGAGSTDAPGHESDYGIVPFASDLYELVTQLGWRDFTLVGHSLGGATVAQFAVDHPDLLKALVLLDPTDPDGREAAPEQIERLIEERMAARRAQQARGGGGDGIDAAAGGAPAEFLRLLTADINAAPEVRLRGSLRSLFTLRLGAAVKRLPMPVLLACGDADKLIPIGQLVATWAKYPPGTGLHVWHGVGHSPNVDIPSELAGLLRRFIEQTVPQRLAAAR
jgi:pimeloyl-ACP methyl ester carboxylesterase